MMAFPVEQGDDMTYVLMEGNGRTAGLKAAVDIVKSKHVDFVAPHLNINVFTPGKEDALAMKNLLFFLDLNWRTQFPDVDLKGWRRQVPNSIKEVSEDLVATINR